MKRNVPAILTAAVLAIAFAACSGSDKKEAGKAPEAKAPVPQVLTYITMTDAVGLSPLKTNDFASSNVIRAVFETLFFRDAVTGEVKPLLAESYTNPDPNKWVITLRKNVKFHDGTPFTSAAVKYTFEKIMDPKTASPRASLLASVKSIETPDDNTVVLNTKAPFGIMLTALAHDNLSIVNPASDKAGDINRNAAGAGTGPFKFEGWQPGDRITLVRNPDYWQGAPKLEKVTYKVVPEMSTAVSMLETGEADFLVTIPAEQLDRLKGNKDISVVLMEGNPVRYVSYNFEKKPFGNLKVRQAIAHAIDKDAYIGTLNGLGYKSSGVIGPKLIGYNKDVEDHGFKYGVAKAKQLLAEAGFPNGFKTTLTVGNTDLYMKMAPFIQGELKKIGIEVELNVLDWAAYIAYVKAGKQEMFLGGWANVTGDGEEFLYPNAFSKSINASNFARYNKKEADDLIMKTRVTIDQPKRLEFLREANIKFVEDVVFIPVYHDVVSLAARRNVKGIVFEPNNEFRLNGVYKE